MELVLVKREADHTHPQVCFDGTLLPALSTSSGFGKGQIFALLDQAGACHDRKSSIALHKDVIFM